MSGGKRAGEKEEKEKLFHYFHNILFHVMPSLSHTFLPMKVFMSGELPFLVKATGKRVR